MQSTSTIAPYTSVNHSQNPNTRAVNIGWVLEGHERAEAQGMFIPAPNRLPVDSQPKKRKKLTRAQIRASKGRTNIETKKGDKKKK
jgi:hypothetical protein